MQNVEVAIYSDFICPWCHIGKARMDRLKQKLAGEFHIDIEPKPYLLYPFIPKGGLPKEEFSKKTKPGIGKSLRHEAEIEGISLNYREIQRIPNSLEAHRLVEIAPKEKKYGLARQIFHAYFEEGKNIEELGLLLELGKEQGLSEESLHAFSKSEFGKKEVEEALAEAKGAFISVVPTLQMGPQLYLPSLQPIEVWENYIRKAARMQGKT